MTWLIWLLIGVAVGIVVTLVALVLVIGAAAEENSK